MTGRRLAALAVSGCFAAISLACAARVAPPSATASPPESVPEQASVPVGDPAAGPEDCALISEPGEPIATVALNHQVDPFNAPRPSNDSERLLFGQLYETLVRVDCSGRIAPALAGSWRRGEDGRHWIVTIRSDARFSDGTLVTAGDVQASWQREVGSGELRPQVRRLIESVASVSDDTLAVVLRQPTRELPITLAHPDLSVAKFVSGTPWPLGTRSASVREHTEDPSGAARITITVSRNNLPDLRFVVAPGDPRDLLDAGVDLLLTREPAALDYAATLPAFQSVPLAWGPVYALVTPARLRSSPLPSPELRQSLASDAVQGEAQGANGPFWWERASQCGWTSRPGQVQPSLTPRIVYDAADSAARNLAERLVGVASASDPPAAALLNALLPDWPRRTFQRAVGLTGDTLEQARRRGADTGYIVPLDTRPFEPCRDLDALIEAFPWLDPETIVPLVETRRRAVVRRGRAGLTIEGDGGLSIAGTPLGATR